MRNVRKFTPEEEREIVSQHMRKIGRADDKRHMSEIGKKGRATMVKNLLDRAAHEA